MSGRDCLESNKRYPFIGLWPHGERLKEETELSQIGRERKKERKGERRGKKTGKERRGNKRRRKKEGIKERKKRE